MRGTEEDFVGVFLSRAWQPGSVWHLCLPASPAWVGFVPLGSASPLSSPGLCRDKSSLAPRCTFQAVPTAQPRLPQPLSAVFSTNRTTLWCSESPGLGFAQSHALGLAAQLMAEEGGPTMGQNCFHGEEQNIVHTAQPGHTLMAGTKQGVG